MSLPKEDWTCSPIYCKLHEEVSFLKGWPCQLNFNIEDSIDQPENLTDVCTIMSACQPFVLPNRFLGLDAKTKLLMELKISAMKAGFALVHRLSKSKKQLDAKYDVYLSLHCQHGLKYTGKEKTYKQVYKTKYCTKRNEPCTFRINIALLKDNQHWLIMNTKGSRKSLCSMHCGHFKLHPTDIHTNLSLLSKPELDLAKKCSQICLTSSITAELLNIRNYLGINNSWTRHQIYYKTNKCTQLENDASSAENLIATFKNRTDTNYLYITYVLLRD